MEVSRPGTKSQPQLQLWCSCGTTRSFNPLHQFGDWTHASTWPELLRLDTQPTVPQGEFQRFRGTSTLSQNTNPIKFLTWYLNSDIRNQSWFTLHSEISSFSYYMRQDSLGWNIQKTNFTWNKQIWEIIEKILWCLLQPQAVKGVVWVSHSLSLISVFLWRSI